MRLSDFAMNRTSQFGENGMIAEVLRRIGDGGKVAVEFGAGDGLSCSNTAPLWSDQGWRGVLIEASPGLAARCRANVDPQHTTVIEAAVLASDASQSIDAILEANGIASAVDVMSVDVDGDDFWIVTGMAVRPRLLIVEFNPTIPPHLERFAPTGPGNRLGVGVATLRQGLEWRGYSFIGMSEANSFFVQSTDASLFADLETDLAVLMPPDRFMYLATDMDGFVVPCGARPPWGLRWPPSPTLIAPNTPGVLTIEATDPVERLLQQVLSELAEIRSRG